MTLIHIKAKKKLIRILYMNVFWGMALVTLFLTFKYPLFFDRFTINKITGIGTWSYIPVSCMEKICNFKTNGSKVLMLGDSHAQQYKFGFEKIYAEQKKFKPFLVSSNIVIMLENNRIHEIQKKILELRKIFNEYNQGDKVVLSFYNGHEFLKLDKQRLKVARVLNEILPQNLNAKDVIIVFDHPHLTKISVSACMRNNEKCVQSIDDHQEKKFLEKQFYSELLNVRGWDASDISFWDNTDYFCDAQVCRFFKDDVFLLVDDNHITEKVSKQIVKMNFQ